VAEFPWVATTPLSRTLAAGRNGATAGTAGLTMTELTGFDLVQFMARRGQWDAAATAAAEHFGAPAPKKLLAVRAGKATLIWSGPDQFLFLAARSAGSSAIDAARQPFAGIASLSEQSDGRALIRISGPRARDMLAKVCSLDLHPAAFPAGSAAATSIDHTPVTLWRGEDGADGAAVFNLLVFSSFAESLCHTIVDSGAEYGTEIGVTGAWLP
jgi:sarcosine oxidase subunit gamma